MSSGIAPGTAANLVGSSLSKSAVECFFFSSRRRHTRYWRDWSSDVCSSDLGTMTVRAWTGLHQKLGSCLSRGQLAQRPVLPIVRGTVLQVVVDHLPDGRKPPKDLWLWHAGPVPADPDLLWKAYLRRFDQEHFHRFAKSYLGLASAHLSSAAATDRWVALTIGAY